jgi:hypothetical protein
MKEIQKMERDFTSLPAYQQALLPFNFQKDRI